MKKILITGSSGYVGRQLSLHLSKKHKVFCFDRKKSSKIKNKISYCVYPKNINDYANFLKKKKIDVIIHSAGFFVANNNYLDVDKLIDVDVKKTLYLLEAAKLANVKNFISLGSYFQFSELNSKFSPTNLYAATKQSINTVSMHYSKNYKINFVQLIIFDTYGKKDKRNKIINSLVKLKKNSKFTIHNPNNYFFPVYISDLCDAIEISINYLSKSLRTVNKQFFIKPSKGFTIYELVNIISKLKKINFTNIIYLNQIKKNKLSIKLNVPILPNWKPKVKFHDGIKKLI